ncbi:hypothetical protein FNV43_RR05712 [Rhamnella rubrinervis]|uniref:DYW domain-containing protein n=1 Tax=Rhamnella rubrinervis TaxID=2594499 RepID=A0A8K0HPJ7_9ROSA|nr:hypothetical protein FNV43_RR05712 [Rhamnella rubrinervis]
MKALKSKVVVRIWNGFLRFAVTEMQSPLSYQAAPSSPTNHWPVPILPLSRHQASRALFRLLGRRPYLRSFPLPATPNPFNQRLERRPSRHRSEFQTNQGHRMVQDLVWFTTEGGRPLVFVFLKACARALARSEARQIHSQIVRSGFGVDVLLQTTLLDVYAKVGDLDCAERVFDEMGRRDIAAMKEEEGLKPNEVTVLGALSACSQLGALKEGEKIHRKCLITWNTIIMAFAMHGLVDDGFRLFNSMRGCGVVPNVKHYGSVVDLLGRAGRLEEAYEIIDSMPMYPDVVLWQSLLGACKTYGNVEMAEMASRKLVEMGSNHCGDFVLLSNVYASYERWDDVGGYTEVDGVIHKFINGDQSHDEWRRIYAKLDEIKFKMKPYGYVAKTSVVLHDIGEEDKENVLYYHSEKLAVAFGLISTNEDTPIQVIKNLRICWDCHVVIKLISKIYNREIVVRDRARFHRFKEGFCSCKDYW